jgi:DNA (cytosine-5)-methyltransferase 1
MTEKLSVISLYSGAGGMDYGFEAAGFETHVALEMDHDCCETLRSSRDFAVIEAPVEQVPSARLLAEAGLKRGEVALLIGGPPCQPFSKAGYWSNGNTLRLQDPRARTLPEYMRCVEDTLPRVFVLENVAGISYTGKEEGFQLLLQMTEDINRRQGTSYRLSWKVINAATYGVPQLRERFFLVGHREGKKFVFPDETHGDRNLAPADLFGPSKQPLVTAWDALADVPVDPREDLKVRGAWADLLPSIPEGENYLWHTNRKGGLPLFGWRTRYWSFLLKLAKDRPSWTIQAQPGPAIGPFHWSSRMLSVWEMASIQTFPRDVVFIGNRGSVQRQIGNAVPSLITEIVGRAILEQFFGRVCSTPLRLAVPMQGTVPSPEPVAQVPQKFLYLVGDHEAHPGTGKGRLYRRDHAAGSTASIVGKPSVSSATIVTDELTESILQG